MNITAFIVMNLGTKPIERYKNILNYKDVVNTTTYKNIKGAFL